LSGAKAAKDQPTVDRLLLGRGLHDLEPKKLADLEEKYHALTGMSELVNGWKPKGKRAAASQNQGQAPSIYRLSAANQLNFNGQAGNSELEGYGGIICIPKFGVVRLAEMIVHPHSRTLNMFQVQMCSSGHGTTTGGGSSGSGGVGGP
jgi:hypothetical protein